MTIDNIAKASLLYDFYGQLLTKRKREVMELYYEENLSLTEIADEFGISKQAVSDSLKNAVKSLNEYEEKLGLVKKLQATNHVISQIDDIMDKVIGNLEAGEKSEDTIASLKTVKDIIDKLED